MAGMIIDRAHLFSDWSFGYSERKVVFFVASSGISWRFCDRLCKLRSAANAQLILTADFVIVPVVEVHVFFDHFTS